MRRRACARQGIGLVVAVAGLLVLAACGGGGGGPTAPVTNPPPPNYAGNWAGTYTVSSCTNTGFFADAALCSVLNTTAQASFALSQTDRTVTGTFGLGALTSPTLTATIGSDGSLTLAAAIEQGVFTIDTTWTLQQTTPGVLTGQTRQVWTAMGQSGQGVVQGAIVTVTRSSGLAAPPPL